MQIIANAKGTRTIEITSDHIATLRKYKLFRNLIDSNGIVDETVLGKLRLNVRALLEHEGTSDKSLMDLCFDVIYNPNMKAIGLHNLIKLYAEHDVDGLSADDQEGA
ncbi:MAG: hypothetical protein NC344_06060 [Bacteroidales bacterium]|nr:hypothetical protein [Bacteroidales bacterium]MCM1147385.1 hypothetical protein [Bacteroidales bacterium]MCM1207180.1 hypothetical protein [Bacillota bacterium]MCM1510413.1 hypothetical protein [Clostridium sp.]